MPTQAQIDKFKRWTDDPAPGDRELLAQWDRAVWRQARYWLRRLGLPDHALEDLHADGVIALLKVEPNKRPYNAYIHKALKNKVQLAAEKLAQRGGGGPKASCLLYGDMPIDPSLDPLDLLGMHPSPEGESVGRMDMASALGSLKPAHRQILLLRYFEGLGLEECGHALGVTRQAAYARSKAAMKALRGRLVRLGRGA